MLRPLTTPESHRNGTNAAFNIRAALAQAGKADAHGAPNGSPHTVDFEELELLRTQNIELRTLCNELEQALQEASQQNRSAGEVDVRIRDLEATLEEKDDVIRGLHQDLQSAQCAIAEAEAAAQAPQKRVNTGPVPREDELLALSEELERERRQLQEDEQTLMDQMREMEVGMAKERADMARQRNDLQRLQNEVSHELERLEKSGALQSKIENLRGKLQDVSTRRGAAHAQVPQPSAAQQPAPDAAATPPKKKDSFIGRLFR